MWNETACAQACVCECEEYVRLCLSLHLNSTQPHFATLAPAALTPECKDELDMAVKDCLKISIYGDCADKMGKSMGDWDVSAITDMRSMFLHAFMFKQDLSKWDVSAVTEMRFMFHRASAFKRELCGFAWASSRADKSDMFKESPGSIVKTVCTRATSDYDAQG